MSTIDSAAICKFIADNKLGDACVFDFNGKYVVVGGSCVTPGMYNLEDGTISFVCDTVTRNKGDVITSIAISADGTVCAAGYVDGSVMLWDIAKRSAGARYKLIHKSEIMHVAFLGNNTKIVVGDKSGVITFLSLVQSCLCELVLQTTIIDLKTQVAALSTCYPDIVSFASRAGFSLFKAGRKMEILINMERFDQTNLSCDIQQNDGKIRSLICWGNRARVVEVLTDKSNHTVMTIQRLKESVVCGFIMKYEYVLLILENGIGQIYDSNAKLIHEMTDLPVKITANNIKLQDQHLVFFGMDGITEKIIDIDDLIANL